LAQADALVMDAAALRIDDKSWIGAMSMTSTVKCERRFSPLERQAADALRRARRLPPGSGRNDLRQLASALLWLHRNGMDALVERRRKVWASRAVDRRFG
jgi:hypothetical protein